MIKDKKPGYKRKIFFSRLKKNLLNFKYDWLGDISFPFLNYFKPQDRTLKTRWYYFYANVIIIFQILFDILQILGAAMFGGEIFLFVFILFIFSLIYRIKCRSYLIKLDIKAYTIIKFYHIYFYIISYICWMIGYMRMTSWQDRNLIEGQMLLSAVIFFLWSLPNIIYFRRRLYMFGNYKDEVNQK